MGKKGLSGIITTVVLIALSLAAVGVVWFVLQGAISDEAESIVASSARINLQIESVAVSDSEALIKVKRDLGRGNLSKIKFILTDIDGDTHSIEAESLMTEYEQDNFLISIPKNITKVAVAPMVKTESGKDYTLGITDEKDVEVVAEIDYEVLLLHMDDGGLTDSSDSNHPITKNGGVARNSSQSKFGGYSVYFDGVDDYISIPDSEAWNFGDDDFTIDFWVYPTGLVEYYRPILSQYRVLLPGTMGEGSFRISFAPGANQLLQAMISLEGSNFYFSGEQTDFFSINAWHHLAFVRNGNTFRVYGDGSELIEFTNSGTIFNSNQPLLLGYNKAISDGNDYFFQGYIDELRISKGIARWTSDFIPPTQPYF